MEREPHDVVNLLEGDDIDGNVVGNDRSQPRPTTVGDEHRGRWESAGQESFDQLLSLDHELTEVARLGWSP